MPINPKFISTKINNTSATKNVPILLGCRTLLPFISVGIEAANAHLPPITQNRCRKAKNKKQPQLIVESINSIIIFKSN
jgi:hypothetical protein